MLLAAVCGFFAAATAGSPDVGLGIKSVRARLGETVYMQVYLNNFSNSTIHGCSFTVQPDNIGVLNAGGLNPSDSIVVRHGTAVSVQKVLSDAEKEISYVPRFTFDFSSRPIGRGSFEVLSFPVTPANAARSYINNRMYLTLKDGEVLSSEGTALELDSVRRWVTIDPDFLISFKDVGNVNGMGLVDELDVMRLLEVLNSETEVLLSEMLLTEFRKENASVDADPAITTLDGAIILQYAYGMIPELPVAVGADPGFSPSIRLAEPEPVPGDASLYRVDVLGSGLVGLISLKAEIALDTSTVAGVKSVATGVPGARSIATTDLASATCRAMFVTADSLDTSDRDLISLVVEVRGGTVMPRALIDSAVVYINDRRLVATATTRARSPARHIGPRTFALRNVVAPGAGTEWSYRSVDLRGRTVGGAQGNAALRGASGRYVVRAAAGVHMQPTLVIQSR